MLAYLDALLDALSLRDAAAVDRLLAHPLARILPDAARDEVETLVSGAGDPLAAPLRVMQLRHVTAELLRDEPVVADRAPIDAAADAAVERGREPRRAPAAVPSRPARLVQMELPLSA